MGNGIQVGCHLYKKKIIISILILVSYSERFGMHYVDFADVNRTRIAKDSAKYYASLVKKNGFEPESFEPCAIADTTAAPSVTTPDDSGSGSDSLKMGLLVLLLSTIITIFTQ